jgi:hypothetical protein
MMAPASATYQQAVPTPLIAPLRMRYCKDTVRSYLGKRSELPDMLWQGFTTHPLISKLAVAIVRRPLDGEGHRAENEGPLDTDFVHDRSTQETN